MKPMMKPTKKRLKFKEGDTVPGFDSPERRALLARARAFVEARGEGNEMSPAQEAMLRRQEGREYGLRGEEPPRTAARPAPRSTPAAPRASSRQELGNSWEESAGISSAPAATARASRTAMSTPTLEAEAPSRPRAADRQELGNSWEESAGYAPTPRRQAVGSSPDMYDMAQSSVPEMERERVRGEREIPPVTSPEQAQKLGRSIGQRLQETLLSGGATDVRNMLSALAPGAGRMMSRGFGASEEMTRRSELGKAVERATARRQSASEARRNRDVNRMEGESIGPVVPAMPVRPPRTKPNAKGNSRSRARQRSAEGEDQYLNSGQYKKGGMAKFAKGGAVSARADGIAQRGKTNCKIY